MSPALHCLSTPDGPTFAVMDLPSALAAVADYDAVISVLDPGMAVDFPPHPNHHVFGIRDVVTAQGASVETLREILDLDLSQAKRVLVHCEVGVSRSPAVAMLLAARWGADDAAIREGMNWAQACPNRRILELGEGLLGMPGRLMALRPTVALDPSPRHERKVTRVGAACFACGSPLGEDDARGLAVQNRLINLLVPHTRLKAAGACAACEERYASEAPEGFGENGWRDILATHVAATLLRTLEHETDPEMRETVAFTQTLTLNLLNAVENDLLLAAKEQVERVLPTLLSTAMACDEPCDPSLGTLELPARHRIPLPGDRVLEVRGLPEAQQIYRDFDAVVSLQDPWAEAAWDTHPCHWIFRVRDIEGEGEHAPSLDLVRQILDLNLGDAHRILVHCHEGFSRSTATAILLATRLGADRQTILDGIDWTHAYPNRRLLNYGEILLGTGGTLEALVEEGLKRGGWR